VPVFSLQVRQLMQRRQFIGMPVTATQFYDPLAIPGSLRHKARHGASWVVMQGNAVNVDSLS
jgi:hypothetical protein